MRTIVKHAAGWLGVATLALALGGAARAEGPTSGLAELKSKDSAHGTLVIGEATYQVTDRTALLDEEGRRIRLVDVPVPEAGSKDPLRELVYGEFEAAPSRGGLVLRRLSLVEPPR